MSVKFSIQFITILTFVMVTIASNTIAAIYYVDINNGNDSWSGTLDAPNGNNGPFKSIQRAINAIGSDAGNSTGNVEVQIRAGDYFAPKYGWTLSEDISGKNGFQVILRNYPGENPRIIGGIQITGWEKVEGENYYVADFDHGYGGDYRLQMLTENDRYALAARYPNRIVEDDRNRYLEAVQNNPVNKTGFYYKSSDNIPEVEDTNDLQVAIWNGGKEGFRMWFQRTYFIASFDWENRKVKLADNNHDVIGTGTHYYLQNAKEFIDQPGEWYYDYSAKKIYYLPYNTEIENQLIIANNWQPVFKVQGSNVVINGLTFLNGGRYRKYSENPIILLKNQTKPQTGNVVKNCKMLNIAGIGVTVAGKTEKCTIENNFIANVGIDAVKIGASNYNVIQNNYLRNVGLVVGHGAGLYIWRSHHTTVAHNRIDRSKRFGILGITHQGKNEEGLYGNTIHYNELSDCMRETQDGGSIYFNMNGSNSGKPGDVIKRNSIHHSTIRETFGGVGIYLDSYPRDTRVIENILCDLQKAPNSATGSAIVIKGDRHTVAGNIVAESRVKGDVTFVKDHEGLSEDNSFERNILSNNYDVDKVTDPVLSWTDTWHRDLLKYCDNNFYHTLSGNYSIDSYSGGPKSIKELKEVFDSKYAQRSLTGSPRFMDAAKRDFRVRYDSDVNFLGHQPWDVENIGLQAGFPYTVENDSLDKVFVKETGKKANVPTINLSSGEKTTLEVLARTKAGCVMNLENATVVFTSDSSDVASVDDSGRINAISAGVAKITAAVTSQNRTRSADIFVIVDDVSEKVNIDAKTDKLHVGDSLQLYATGVTHFGQKLYLTESATWSSLNPEIAEVNATGKISAHQIGDVAITAAYSMGGVEQRDTFSINVEVAVGSIRFEKKAGGLKVFPNPALNSIQVESNEELVQIEIYSGEGQLIYLAQTNGKHATVPVEKYSSGLYILACRTIDTLQKVRFVKY